MKKKEREYLVRILLTFTIFVEDKHRLNRQLEFSNPFFFRISGVDKTTDREEKVEGAVHTGYFPYYSYMNQVPTGTVHTGYFPYYSYIARYHTYCTEKYLRPLLQLHESQKLQAEFTILRCTLYYLRTLKKHNSNVEVVEQNPTTVNFCVSSGSYYCSLWTFMDLSQSELSTIEWFFSL